jgi:hypothetical protein
MKTEKIESNNTKKHLKLYENFVKSKNCTREGI